jgi:hypothetical protein
MFEHAFNPQGHMLRAKSAKKVFHCASTLHCASNEAEMQAAVTELWEEIPQEWINGLIDRQRYWVHELIKHCGWSSPVFGINTQN